MSITLVEQFALESVAINDDGSRRVRLISPGQGSSGVYSREVLSRYIAEALPAGTLVYLDHTSDDDEWKRDGTRSIRDIAGKIITAPTYEEAAKEGEGSYANVKFTRSVEPMIEDVGDAIGVSVEIHAGRKDEYGNVIEMSYHPLNSLAVVPVPGRDGRIFEDFRAKAQETHDNGGTDMPISEDDRKAIVADVLVGLKEALKPEPAVEPETAVNIPELATKLAEAKLPKELAKIVAEAAVKPDADIDALIAEQVALVESLRGDKESDAELVLTEGDKPLNKTVQATPATRGATYMEKHFAKKGGAA